MDDMISNCLEERIKENKTDLDYGTIENKNNLTLWITECTMYSMNLHTVPDLDLTSKGKTKYKAYYSRLLIGLRSQANIDAFCISEDFAPDWHNGSSYKFCTRKDVKQMQ